jgi:hypothetical protein
MGSSQNRRQCGCIGIHLAGQSPRQVEVETEPASASTNRHDVGSRGVVADRLRDLVNRLRGGHFQTR